MGAIQFQLFFLVVIISLILESLREDCDPWATIRKRIRSEEIGRTAFGVLCTVVLVVLVVLFWWLVPLMQQ